MHQQPIIVSHEYKYDENLLLNYWGILIMILCASIELPSNRKFGLLFSCIFAALSLYFFINAMISIAYGCVVMFIVVSIITVIDSKLLTPFNRLWMCFGLLVGKIVSPLVLFAIFFGLFTPIGIIMRVFGRDELRLKLKSNKTYWRNRFQVNDIKNSFKNQF